MAKKKLPRHKVAMMPAHSESNWRAHDDMHTLKRAAEVKADPKRHGAAKEMARNEVHHLKKVAGRAS